MTTQEPVGLPDLAGATPAPDELRGVLQYPQFRRLWIALSLSSLGDWLGLLATTSLAATLSSSDKSASFAIGGVLFVRLLPALVLGPLAGVFADRFERRTTMVTCDVMRFGVFLSIPFVHSLAYLFAASFVAEAISLFWIPAKEASVPNLLPAHKLEVANQFSLITTYGSAPVAAAVFAGLASFSDALGAGIPFFKSNPTNLALYFDAGTFLFSAVTVMRLGDLGSPRRANRPERTGGMLADLVEGFRFMGQTKLVRGLVVGILGAFAAGGTVIATGRLFVQILGGGQAAYGLLFGSVFTGLAIGMGFGPRVFADLSRRRLFGLSIVGAGSMLCVTALLPNLILALIAVLWLGAFAGIAWITGYTLLGAEIDNEVRGRAFAAVQSLVRIDLLVTLAAAPVIAGAIGFSPHLGVGRARIRLDGVTLTMFGAGLLAAGVGIVAYRQMDDGTQPLWREVIGALRSYTHRRYPGVLVAFEGGEGTGKSTQAKLLADALGRLDYDVVATFEPGATAAGKRIRKVLLDPKTDLAPEAEALLYAADRADHTAKVLLPGLERGAVVITDRFVDSSLAYQGAGRTLSVDDVRRVSSWATGGMVPDLTIVLDIDPSIGLSRAGESPDRIEAESLDFHRAVRDAFRDLAGRAPARYVLLDATESPDAVHKRVMEAVLRVVTRRLPAEE